MEKMKDLNEIIELERNNRNINKGHCFNWGKYTEVLQVTLGKEINKDIIVEVQDFIIATDLIDDLMDEDRMDINDILVKSKIELNHFLLNTLNNLKKLVHKQCYNNFEKHISRALHYQKLENKYKLSIDSKEADYYCLVKRSTFLMQSIIFLADSSPPDHLMKAIELISIIGQIDNDISEFKLDIPYDLLDSRGTLPLIKTIEWAKKNNRKDLVNEILETNRLNHTINKLNALKMNINNGPGITYCYLKKLSLENEAKKILKENNLKYIYMYFFHNR